MNNIAYFIAIISFVKSVQTQAVTNLRDLGPSLNFVDYNGNLQRSCIDDVTSFNCDFSTTCPFGPTETNQNWVNITGHFSDYQKFKDSLGTSTMPDLPSVGVQLGQEPFAVLLTDPIPCVQDGIEVIFSVWTTPGVSLKVCFIDTTTGQDIECSSQEFSSTSNGYPAFFQYKKPGPINQQFKIEFMAITTPDLNGFLILDDIGIFGKVCENGQGCGADVFTQQIISTTSPVPSTVENTKTSTSTASSSPSTPSTTTRSTSTTSTTKTTSRSTGSTKRPPVTLPLRKPNSIDICSALPCNFENKMCGYQSITTPAFERRSGKYSSGVSPVFNIREPNGFYASTLLNVDSNEKSILFSQKFSAVPAPGKVLNLKFFRPAIGTTMDVCFDSNLQNSIDCRRIFGLTGANGMKWNSFSVPVPQSTIRVRFIALTDRSSSNTGKSPVAIDNIEVTGC